MSYKNNYPKLAVPLTLREVTILDRLARGFNYEAIAKEQGVSVATLDTYMRVIRTKMSAQTTIQAVAFATYKKLIHPFEIPLSEDNPILKGRK